MTRTQFPQISYKRRLLLILALACCMAGKSRAQSASLKDFNIKLDSFVTDLMQKVPVIPAITVTMVNENGTVFNKAFGYANKEAGIKADLNTSFYIASSTKSFT